MGLSNSFRSRTPAAGISPLAAHGPPPRAATPSPSSTSTEAPEAAQPAADVLDAPRPTFLTLLSGLWRSKEVLYKPLVAGLVVGAVAVTLGAAIASTGGALLPLLVVVVPMAAALGFLPSLMRA